MEVVLLDLKLPGCHVAPQAADQEFIAEANATLSMLAQSPETKVVEFGQPDSPESGKA